MNSCDIESRFVIGYLKISLRKMIESGNDDGTFVGLQPRRQDISRSLRLCFVKDLHDFCTWKIGDTDFQRIAYLLLRSFKAHGFTSYVLLFSILSKTMIASAGLAEKYPLLIGVLVFVYRTSSVQSIFCISAKSSAVAQDSGSSRE